MRKAVLLSFLLLSLCLKAQSVKQSIHGKVLDPQGSFVVHADITLRNTLSGAAQTTQTGNDGEYSFSGIAI